MYTMWRLVACTVLLVNCCVSHETKWKISEKAMAVKSSSPSEHLMMGTPASNIITNNVTEDPKMITLLGLFELSRKVDSNVFIENFRGTAELKAAELAIEHVNKAGFLGEYRIALHVNDTKCDPGVTIDTFFHAILARKLRVPILLGSACSEPTASLASIVPYWNVVQISHGARSPVLQDRKQFPTFYRVVPSDASHNRARVQLIQHFGWHTVTVISQDGKEYTLVYPMVDFRNNGHGDTNKEYPKLLL